MQFNNDFILLARDVSVDAKDNMLSIFKLIDKFEYKLAPEEYKKFITETKSKVANLPAVYVLSSSWSIDKPASKETKVILETKVIDPSSKELGKSRNDIVFAPGNDKVRLNGNIEGIPVTRSGRYTVEQSLIDPDTNKVLCSNRTAYRVNVEEDKKPKD